MHTVLVVDDDAAVRRTITRFLGLDGFAAIEADNGLAALTYLRNGGEASVILLDLGMPIMDGWTFRREQRDDAALARIPVIVLSSADVHRSHDLEAVASFRKPASMSALLSCVRRLCENSNAGRIGPPLRSVTEEARPEDVLNVWDAGQQSPPADVVLR